jgi:hypothetical protein
LSEFAAGCASSVTKLIPDTSQPQQASHRAHNDGDAQQFPYHIGLHLPLLPDMLCFETDISPAGDHFSLLSLGRIALKYAIKRSTSQPIINTTMMPLAKVPNKFISSPSPRCRL